MESKEAYEICDGTRVKCPRRDVCALNALDEIRIITDRSGNIGSGQTNAVPNRFDPATERPWTFDVSDRFRMQLRKQAANEHAADSFSACIIRFDDAVEECVDNGIGQRFRGALKHPERS